MSIFRINYDHLSQYIRQLVTPSSIGILHSFHDTAANREIVQALLQAARPLPVRYFVPISELLIQMAGADTAVQQMVRRQVREKKIHEKWDIYKWVLMIIITTLLTWLMIEFAK